MKAGEKMDLYEKLTNYYKSGVYPMHMPGHKRNPDFFPCENPFLLDITEIDGFDNLRNPEDILLDELKKISKICKSKQSIISVNGSTGAIISAIYACTSDGDSIITARNCHISAYNAVKVRKLRASYIFPSVNENTGICGSITSEQVSDAIKNTPDARLIVLTSPTYEGVVSDIRGICEIAHSHNIPVLVDEAHGAHFVFSDYFPDSAVTCGADITVQSFHKTLPCFTGSAVLHLNGSLIDKKRVFDALNIFGTSSPSYLFMAGISRFINTPAQEKEKLFSDYAKRLEEFYEFSSSLRFLSVLKKEDNGFFGFDKGKIVILTDRAELSGKELYDILLKKYKIQCEMSSARYVICMTSVADTDEGFTRLKTALKEIDSGLSIRKNKTPFPSLCETESKIPLFEAEKYKTVEMKTENCIGRISGDFIYAYPPGVPLITAGEVISDGVIKLISEYRNSGVSVYSSDGEITDKLKVRSSLKRGDFR